MNETHWDIQEVKHLKKKQLVQNNLAMLLLFVLFGYLAQNGKHILLFGVFCAIFWIIVAITLYTLITGTPVGTKAGRRVKKFDRNRLGEKRWKRRTIVETVIIGVWIGYNIGEIIRMHKL